MHCYTVGLRDESDKEISRTMWRGRTDKAMKQSGANEMIASMDALPSFR